MKATKSPSKKQSKKTSKRSYDATSRIEKSNLVQKQVIETFVELLTERPGEDVNIDEIAKRSGISERTIYRLFNDKATLNAATDEYTRSYLTSTSQQIAMNDVPSFTKILFGKFDENENLVIAYLFSRFGMQARAGFRQKFNQLITTKILQDKKLPLTKEREKKLAVITALINAKIWHDIRTDFGLSGLEIGDAVSNAIRILIEDL